MPVLSNDMPSRFRPSSGTLFHSLQATSHALQPMQTEVSVKKPTRGGCSRYPASAAGSASGPWKLFCWCAMVLLLRLGLGVSPGGPVAGREDPGAGFPRDPRAAPVPGDVCGQRRAAGAASGLDVAGQDLAFLNEDVRVGDHAE